MSKQDLIRSQQRVRAQGEVFTPPSFAHTIIHRWMSISQRKAIDVFADLQCGTGNLLCAVLQWKIDQGLSNEKALKTTLGADISMDNVQDCRNALLHIAGDAPHYRHIVEHTIVQGDSIRQDLDVLFPNFTNPKE